MSASRPETSDGQVRSPSFTRVDARGTLMEVLNTGQWACLLCGRMKAQAVMGNHYHKRTDVFFFLTDGRAEVLSQNLATGERQQHRLAATEGIWLKTNVAHAIRFHEESSFVMLKSLPYDRNDPDTFAHPLIDAA